MKVAKENDGRVSSTRGGTRGRGEGPGKILRNRGKNGDGSSLSKLREGREGDQEDEKTVREGGGEKKGLGRVPDR